MKYVGNGYIWDPVKNKALGPKQIDTDDVRIAELCWKAGWINVEVVEEKAPRVDLKADLIDRAVELGIGPKSTLSRWSVDKLTTEIDKVEECTV